MAEQPGKGKLNTNDVANPMSGQQPEMSERYDSTLQIRDCMNSDACGGIIGVNDLSNRNGQRNKAAPELTNANRRRDGANSQIATAHI